MTLTVQEVTAQEGDFWGKVGDMRKATFEAQVASLKI